MITAARLYRSKPTISLTGLCFALLAPALLCAAQQSGPMLQIDSPTTGTILNPGQAITAPWKGPARKTSGRRN